MQVANRYREGSLKDSASRKELLLMHEIGLDQIPTATDFVSYASDRFGMSQSGIWYTLKKLKRAGLLDFTEKGEENRPLTLTMEGVGVLRSALALEGGDRHEVRRMAQVRVSV